MKWSSKGDLKGCRDDPCATGLDDWLCDAYDFNFLSSFFLLYLNQSVKYANPKIEKNIYSKYLPNSRARLKRSIVSFLKYDFLQPGLVQFLTQS